MGRVFIRAIVADRAGEAGSAAPIGSAKAARRNAARVRPRAGGRAGSGLLASSFIGEHSIVPPDACAHASPAFLYWLSLSLREMPMSETGHPVHPTAPVERRAAAIEAALEAQGLKPGEFVLEATRKVEQEWLPANGARLVARAWTDPAFRQRLLADGRAAAAEFGFELPRHHRHLVFLENTAAVHNVICCTLCSCTAFTIIGLPPDWYKDLE
ncbi:MAG TPA: nitrile hydratase subunit alpha [Caldimonas sp.]